MNLHDTTTEVRPAGRPILERRLRTLLALLVERQRKGGPPDASLEADINTLQLELKRTRPWAAT